MKFHVVGADRESGNDIELDVSATDRVEAEQLATKRGVMVSTVTPIKDADPEALDLVLDDEPHATSGTVAGVAVPGQIAHASVAGASAAGASVAGRSMAGKSMAGASVAGASVAGASVAGASVAGKTASGASVSGGSVTAESHGSISGAIGASTSQPGAHLEYHIILNQSLYLLEVAVNKHIKEGWEPQGGLSIGMANNAQQFYQAMIRHKD